jgi:hypothetical protein
MTRPVSVTTGVADISAPVVKFHASTRLATFATEIAVYAPLLVLVIPLPQFFQVVPLLDESLGPEGTTAPRRDVVAKQLPLIFQPLAPMHTALILLSELPVQDTAQWGFLVQRAGQEAPLTAGSCGKAPHVLVTAFPGYAAWYKSIVIMSTAMVIRVGVAMLASWQRTNGLNEQGLFGYAKALQQ